jgi:hypothetical protein
MAFHPARFGKCLRAISEEGMELTLMKKNLNFYIILA